MRVTLRKSENWCNGRVFGFPHAATNNGAARGGHDRLRRHFNYVVLPSSQIKAAWVAADTLMLDGVVDPRLPAILSRQLVDAGRGGRALRTSSPALASSRSTPQVNRFACWTLRRAACIMTDDHTIDERAHLFAVSEPSSKP